MKKCTLIIILNLLGVCLYAQGDIDNEQKSSIRNENTYHILLNSNGWGFGYAYHQMGNSVFRKTIWNAEFIALRDNKELKINNPYYPEGRRFVFGKANEFYNFKFGYGKLLRLYEKKDRGGIEIRFFYHFGPVVGVLKPVFYEVLYYDPEKGAEIKTERFNSSIHSYVDIYGRASYFKGFSKIGVVPGAYLRFGGSFEFSKKDLAVNALEGGFGIEVFPKNVEIMQNDKNKFYFISLFVSYRFGKIINPRLKYQQQNRELNN
jgi:hypothetical protein